MSVLLAAASAASLAPPIFTQEASKEFLNRYPQEALQKNQSATSLFEAQVDPKGRVIRCNTLATAGSEPLANSICGLIKGMKIQPASVDGQAAYGVVRTITRMYLPGSPGSASLPVLKQGPDVQLQVNKLPDGQTSLRVNVNLLVDAIGKPQGCNPAKNDVPDYADVACTQVGKLTFDVLNDNSGKPVQYVRQVIVEFDLGSASTETAQH